MIYKPFSKSDYFNITWVTKIVSELIELKTDIWPSKFDLKKN